MHPTEKTGMFHFQTFVDDDIESTRRCNINSLFVDDSELEPDSARADLDGFVRDSGRGIRRAKNVDGIYRLGDVQK